MSAVLKKEIPEGWVWTTLGEAFKWGSGGTPKRTNPKYYGGDIPWLIIGDLNDGPVGDSETKITEEGLKNSSAKWVEPGSVLLAMYGSIGKLGIATERLTTNQAIAFTQPEPNDAKYLFYYLMFSRDALAREGKGMTQLNISQTVIKAFPFPLAPLEQQKRIVAKIEELFSHIDAGIEALKKAKQLLKQYRQSVLKAAVTGELTKEWREANKDKLEPASQLLERILKERREKWEEQQLEQFKAKGKIPRDDKWKEKYKEPHSAEYEGYMPEGWVAVTASQLAEHIVDGTHHTPKYVDKGIDFVSAKNINNWEIDYSDTKKITKEEHEQLIKRCYSKKGDVLLTKSGTLGRAAVVKDDHVFSVFESVAVFPILDKSISDYIVLAIHEAAMGDAGRKIQKGIAVKHLHLEDLRKMEFLLPPKHEIEEIVRVFESVTAASFRLETELEIKLMQAGKNKQSVLASAFSGQL